MKRKIISILMIMMILLSYVEPFTGISFASSELSATSLIPIDKFEWKYDTKDEVDKAVEIVSKNIEELETRVDVIEKMDKKKTKMKFEPLYEKSDLNLLLQLHVLKVQLQTARNSILQQSENKDDIKPTEGDPIKLSKDDFKVITDQAEDIVIKASKKMVNDPYRNAIKLFSECPDGFEKKKPTEEESEDQDTTEDSTQEDSEEESEEIDTGKCGIRTSAVANSVSIVNENALKFAEMKNGEVKESDAKSAKESAQKYLEPLKLLLLASTDMTIPTNGDVKDIEKWVKDNGKIMLERMQLIPMLSQTYKAFGLESDELTGDTGLIAITKNNYKKLKKLAEKAGSPLEGSLTDGLSEEDPLWEEELDNEDEDAEGEQEDLDEIDVSEIAELIDVDNNDLSKEFKSIIAWTSAFTPFVTNINEGNILDRLTPVERQIYKKYGKHRNILYSSVGSHGKAQGLKQGAPFQFKPISLGEFLDKTLSEEMVLFISSESPEKIEEVTATTKDTQDTEGGEGSGETEEGKKKATGDIHSALNTPNQPQETEGSDDEDNPNETETGTEVEEEDPTDTTIDSQVANLPGTNNSNNVINDGETTGGNTEEDVRSERSWNTETSTDKRKVEIPMPKFAGPIYASSGPKSKEIFGLGDAGDHSSSVLMGRKDVYEEDTDSTHIPRGSSLSRLKGNTMNMNYFMIYNTLQNKQQYSPALEEDMSKPIYADFMGNVLTQSGYIVIPAAANYTLYNFSNQLPMYNAMFLNSYPEVYMDDNDTWTITSRLERNKLLYQKSKGGVIKIGKMDKKGESITDSMYALPLQSEALFDRDEDLRVNFMDRIKMFRWISDPFTFSEADTNYDQHDLIYTNTGITLKASDKGEERIINLRRISGDGRGMDWALLKEAHYNFYTRGKDKNINAPLLANTALLAVRSQDDSKSTVLDYVSRDENLRTSPGIIKTIGQLFDGFVENFLGGLEVNQLLYTPKMSETFLIGDTLALRGVQIIMLLTALAIFYYSIRVVRDIAISDFGDIKGFVFAIVALLVLNIFTIFFTDKVMYYIYDLPTQAILKKDMPIYIIDKIEKTNMATPTTFFDTSKFDRTEDTSKPTITLDVLNKEDIKYIREQTGNSKKSENPFYIPRFDRSRANIVGDKIYLRGDELRIDIEDLMEISKVEDVLELSSSVQLKPTYSGYGELAYYMPYFNILETLTDTINIYSNETSPPYRAIRYRQGFTKSTGRAEDFFKSILFTSPDMVEEHIKRLINEYQYNEMEDEFYKNSYSDDDSFVDKDQNTEEEELNEEDYITTFVKDPENSSLWKKESEENDMTAQSYTTEEKDEIIQEEKEEFEKIKKERENPDNNPKQPTQEEIEAEEHTSDEFLTRAKTGHIYGKHIMEMPMTKQLEDELDIIDVSLRGVLESEHFSVTDWLGLSKVLLIHSDPTLFDPMNYDTIKETKWYPRDLMLNDLQLKQIDEKITNINENTRDFVLEKIAPISGEISDDTILKVIALYATMEFNKEFSSTNPSQLYPKQINPQGLSNSFTTKTIMIPQEEIYRGNADQTSLFLARETGWAGLSLALLDRVLYWVRMIIRLTILRFILIFAPIIVIYQFVSKGTKVSDFIKGIITTLLFITLFYIFDVMWYRWAFYITNTSGTMRMLLTGFLPQIIMTFFYAKLVKMIITDLTNFGYFNYKDQVSNFFGGPYYDQTMVQQSLLDERVYNSEQYSSNDSSISNDMYNSSSYNDFSTQNDFILDEDMADWDKPKNGGIDRSDGVFKRPEDN